MKENKMEIYLSKLSESELIDLNREIVSRLRALEKFKNQNEMMKFNIGEKVCFQPPERDLQIGILTKFNQKTVSIITEDGFQWNVAPQLIQKYFEVNEISNASNIIKFKKKM